MTDKKLLVADYNTRELQRLKKLFQDEGFEVITVLDGKAAVEEFESKKPDIVLLSAMLSKINGFDVCKQIKDSDAGRNVPVILATSVYKGQKYRVKAIHENKASEFIEKPVPDEKLVETVLRFAGDTRTLIDSRKGELLQDVAPAVAASLKQEGKPPAPQPAPVPAAKKEAVAASPNQAPPAPAKAESPAPSKSIPAPAAPLSKSAEPPPKAAGPAPKPAKPAMSEMDQIDQMIKAGIGSSLSTPAKVEEQADDSMDKLLSETLSGLGISLDKGKKPASAPAAPAAGPKEKPAAVQADEALGKLMEATIKETPPPLKKPDTTEFRVEKLSAELVKETKPSDTGELAVQRLLRSFDTDLEKKLSDTLSGVGLSDTNIDKVFDSPAKPAVKEKEKEKDKEKDKEKETEEEGIKFGDYLLQEKIGHGGMAELYKAKKRGQEGFQKIVAIKKILPHLSDNQELVTMFIDEAKLAAQLSHQNIANIFDFGKTGHSFYIAMEYVDGFDLKKLLSKAKEKNIRVPHKLAAYIVAQTANALDYAHHKKDFSNRDLNIVHRDVSPQNVLISREGEVKLVDFGISKAESKIHHTVKGALKGKLLYMSPEQAWGKALDKRSDLYSLGIVLCEMVSGKVLFEDSSEFDVLEKVRSGRIPLLENEMPMLPPRLKTIVDKALQIELNNRYQNAGEMAKDLHDYLYSGGPVPSPKDLAAFLTKLFPESFGLTSQEIKNLTFDEFSEKETSAVSKVMSEETVILESEEVANLENLKPAGGEPVLQMEDDEILIDSQAPPAGLPAVVTLKSKPAEPPPVKKEPLPEPKRDQKKEYVKELKKEEPPVREKEREKDKKKGAPPPPVKSQPPVKEKEKERDKEKEKAPEPAKAVLTKKPKDKVQVPSFGAEAPRKTGSKGLWYVLLGVIVIGGCVAAYLYFLRKPAAEGTPPVSGLEQPAAAGQPAVQPGAEGTSQPPAGTENAPATPATSQPVPGSTPAAARSGQPAAAPAPAGSATRSPAQTPPVSGQPAGTVPGRPVTTPPPASQTQAQTPVVPPPSASTANRTEPAVKPAEPPPAAVQTPPSAPAGQPAAPPAEPVRPEPKTEPRTEPKTEAKAPEKPAAPPVADEMQMDLPAGDAVVREGSVVALASVDKKPVLKKEVKPRIPVNLTRMNIRGTLRCSIQISHTGAVDKVRIISGDPARVKEVYGIYAEQALMQWLYTPAEKDGVKVKVWTSVTLVF